MNDETKKENQEVVEAIVEEIRQNNKQGLVIIAEQDNEATDAILGMYGNDTLILNCLVGIAEKYPEVFKHFLTMYASKQLVDFLKQYKKMQGEELMSHTDDFDFSKGN